MRRLMVLLVADVEFVDDDPTDKTVQNCERHLAEVVQEAAANLSLRTLEGVKVKKVQVAEIKGLVSL